MEYVIESVWSRGGADAEEYCDICNKGACRKLVRQGHDHSPKSASQSPHDKIARLREVVVNPQGETRIFATSVSIEFQAIRKKRKSWADNSSACHTVIVGVGPQDIEDPCLNTTCIHHQYLTNPDRERGRHNYFSPSWRQSLCQLKILGWPTAALRAYIQQPHSDWSIGSDALTRIVRLSIKKGLAVT